jgi:hypothetical protein
MIRLSVLTAVILLNGCGAKRNVQPFVTNDEYDIYALVAHPSANEIAFYSTDSIISEISYVVDSTMEMDPEYKPTSDKIIKQRGVVFIEKRQHFTFGVVPYSWKSLAYFWHDFPLDEMKDAMIAANAKRYGLSLDSLSRRSPVMPMSEYAKHEHGTPPERGPWHTSYRFSRVAFNESKSDALVYLEYRCGNDCAAGVWYWCKRTSGTWTVFKRCEEWAS